MAQGKTGPGPHLTLHTLREFHLETRRDQTNLLRSEDEVFFSRPDIVSGRMGCGSGRERQILILGKPLETDYVGHRSYAWAGGVRNRCTSA